MRIFGRWCLVLSRGVLAVSLLGASALTSEQAQKQSGKSQEPPEMQMIEGGFLAIDTPKGWERVQGPGLAFFRKKGVKAAKADVWIYVSGAPIGPGESSKDRSDYIKSDIATFKERFNSGSVQEEEPLELPKAKTKVPVVSFQSRQDHNAFEEVVYIEEQNRVLTLVLSAKSKEAFVKTLPLFQEFAKSYGGSVNFAPDEKRP